MVIYSLGDAQKNRYTGEDLGIGSKDNREAFYRKSMDLRNHTIVTKTVEPAAEEEVEGTEKGYGGRGLAGLDKGFKSSRCIGRQCPDCSLFLIGPRLTYPIYYDEPLKAKRHLKKRPVWMGGISDVRALISVNKALVTQASAAIPLYRCILLFFMV